MKAIIVTGSRDWRDESRIACVLERILPDILIHGCARGADVIAGAWGYQNHISVVGLPAQWYSNGYYDKKAGLKRNEAMLMELLRLKELGYEISVEAFPIPSSKGTRHMMKIAKERGVKINNHGIDY